MTLSFSQTINGEPTYFPEKIWSGLRHLEVSSELATYLRSRYSSEKSILDFEPKLHTIRRDEKDRWQVGSKIHMVINNRTKDRLQFAPVLEVKSIQKIRIRHPKLGEKNESQVYIDDALQGSVIWVNCKLKASSFTVDAIAKNDGFDNTDSFFDWFCEDFEGKIIHWTDLKY